MKPTGGQANLKTMVEMVNSLWPGIWPSGGLAGVGVVGGTFPVLYSHNG